MTIRAKNSWLITGATRGIGLGLTRQHLIRGGHVVATYRDAQSVELTELRTTFPDHLKIIKFDQQNSHSSQQARALLDRPIEVIIHNAGVFGPRTESFKDIDYAETLKTIDINTLGVLRVTEAFLPSMAEVERPRITAISSLMGTIAKARHNHLAYRISKAGLNMIMHGLATELAAQKIAIACLRPGPAKTRMNPNGKISPDESATALLKVIDDLKFNPVPPFLDISGDKLAW